LGIGVVILENQKENLVFSGCLSTDRGLTPSRRLYLLGKEFEKLLKKYRPQVLAIEKLFFAANKKTASRVEAVRGVIIFLAEQNGLQTIELTPQQIKSTVTGYNKATKAQVQKMVYALLGQQPKPALDDETDAIAAALSVIPMLSTINSTPSCKINRL